MPQFVDKKDGSFSVVIVYKCHKSNIHEKNKKTGIIGLTLELWNKL